MSRPTWNQLTPSQKKAAFAINQDNFEQSGWKKAVEWEEFKECFDDKEWEATWNNLLKQAEDIASGKMEA